AMPARKTPPSRPQRACRVRGPRYLLLAEAVAQMGRDLVPRPRLVGAVCLVLLFPVLDQAAMADAKPLFAVARHRLGLRRPLALEALLCLPEPGATAVVGGQPLWELIAAGLAVEPA